MGEKPEVLNHNLETVVRLQREVRTAADYGRSLALLARAKRMSPGGLVKSGLIVGLGETKDEVLGALADLRAVGVDIVTIGQYLRPTARNRAIRPLRHSGGVRRLPGPRCRPGASPGGSRAPGALLLPRRRGAGGGRVGASIQERAPRLPMF